MIDSLRACSLSRDGDATAPHTPFLEYLARTSLCFTRAYAAKC